MAEDERYFRRQGFWLRMARERAGKNQAGAAAHLGMSKSSKSSVSDYENGVTHASQDTLLELARWYGVPLSLFTNPMQTSDEVIEALLDETSQLGRDAERRDWPQALDRGREADDGPGGGPGRLSA